MSTNGAVNGAGDGFMSYAQRQASAPQPSAPQASAAQMTRSTGSGGSSGGGGGVSAASSSGPGSASSAVAQRGMFDFADDLFDVDLGGIGGVVDDVTEVVDDVSDVVGSVGGIVGGVGNVVGSIDGAVDFVENVGDMEPLDAAAGGWSIGSAIGSIIPGIGTVVGGIIGGIGGFVGSLFGGSDPNKEERKAVRGFLAENTSLGKELEYQGYVAPGQMGTITLHGKTHTVDNAEGMLAQATGFTNMLAYSLVGDNERLMTEVSAMFLNSISGAADINEGLESIRSLATAIGFTPESLMQTVGGLYQKGVFDEADAKFYSDIVKILAGALPPPPAIPNQPAPGADQYPSIGPETGVPNPNTPQPLPMDQAPQEQPIAA